MNTTNMVPSEATGTNVTDASTIPPMVYVDKDGLEEQFLMEDEVSQEVANIMANRVTIPLDPINTQRSQWEEELDLQPSRGPREESLVNALDQYLGEEYEDILHTSNIQTNFSISASNRDITGRPTLPLGWIVPDGTN